MQNYPRYSFRRSVSTSKRPLEMRPLWTLLLLAMLPASESWTAYDSTAYTECTSKPKALLYKGGIITNPDFEDGLSGWSPFGSCVLQLKSSEGNTFVAAVNRTASFNGPSQSLANLTSGVKYSLSAWLQVNGSPGSALVKATVVTEGATGKTYSCAGTVIAQSGCWSFLKGGFVLDSTPITSSKLYFETFNFTSGLEIWLDRASVQPFRDEEWHAHQRGWRSMLRSRTVSLHVVDSRKKRVRDADVQVVEAKMGFPFGSAIAQNILSDPQYQKWFVERFNTAVFENELKWYSTEQQQGRVNYNTSDKMLAFCKSNNISVRGHNIFWDDPKFQQQWIKNLGKEELQKAVTARMQSLLGRYAGQFVAGWDVSNEQLHFSFYEDKLGANASTEFFLAAQKLDPGVPLFVNDYNVIETCNDAMSIPDAYVRKIGQLQSAGIEKLGIGLESHFSVPNVAYMRGVLDKMGTLSVPIWLTELDINVQGAVHNNLTLAAEYLEEVVEEAFAHPAVSGMLLWTAWHSGGCYRMCLTDANMHNLPAGDVVDALLRRWRAVDVVEGGKGWLRWRGPVGQHAVAVRWRNATFNASVAVVPGNGVQRVRLQLPVLHSNK